MEGILVIGSSGENVEQSTDVRKYRRNTELNRENEKRRVFGSNAKTLPSLVKVENLCFMLSDAG